MNLPDYKENIFAIYKSIENQEDRLIMSTIMTMVLDLHQKKFFKKTGGLEYRAIANLERDFRRTFTIVNRQSELDLKEKLRSQLSQNLGRDKKNLPRGLPRKMLPICISYINLKNGSEVIESLESLQKWAKSEIAKEGRSSKAKELENTDTQRSITPQDDLIEGENDNRKSEGLPSENIDSIKAKQNSRKRSLVLVSVIILIVAFISVYLNLSPKKQIIESSHPDFNHTLEWANGSDSSQIATISNPRIQCPLITLGNYTTSEGINRWSHGHTCWSTSISPVNPMEVVYIYVTAKLMNNATEYATNVSIRLLNSLSKEKTNSQKLIFQLSGEGHKSHSFFTAVDSVTVEFSQPVIPRIPVAKLYFNSDKIDSTYTLPFLENNTIQIPDIHPYGYSHLFFELRSSLAPGDELFPSNAPRTKYVRWADGTWPNGIINPTEQEHECSFLSIANQTTGDGVEDDEDCWVTGIPPVSPGDEITIYIGYRNIGSETATKTRLRILPLPKVVDSELTVISEILALGAHSKRSFIQYDTMRIALQNSFYKSFNALKLEYGPVISFPTTYPHDGISYEFELNKLTTSGISLPDTDPFQLGTVCFGFFLIGDSTKKQGSNSRAHTLSTELIRSQKAFNYY